LAKSLAEVDAFTVKELFPAGVDVVVEMVSAAVRELSPLANRIVFAAASKQVFWPPEVQFAREPAEKEAEAPVGNAVVKVRAASKVPDEPLPLPRLTVI
jgi:hypothetical protein